MHRFKRFIARFWPWLLLLFVIVLTYSERFIARFWPWLLLLFVILLTYSVGEIMIRLDRGCYERSQEAGDALVICPYCGRKLDEP